MQVAVFVEKGFDDLVRLDIIDRDTIEPECLELGLSAKSLCWNVCCTYITITADTLRVLICLCDIESHHMKPDIETPCHLTIWQRFRRNFTVVETEQQLVVLTRLSDKSLRRPSAGTS